jgi:hypothetical protein
MEGGLNYAALCNLWSFSMSHADSLLVTLEYNETLGGVNDFYLFKILSGGWISSYP